MKQHLMTKNVVVYIFSYNKLKQVQGQTPLSKNKFAIVQGVES